MITDWWLIGLGFTRDAEGSPVAAHSNFGWSPSIKCTKVDGDGAGGGFPRPGGGFTENLFLPPMNRMNADKTCFFITFQGRKEGAKGL